MAILPSQIMGCKRRLGDTVRETEET